MKMPWWTVVAFLGLALALQHQHREKREAGAADHHQMRWAPKGDVLPEDPVPDVVEREPGHRVQPAAGHQHAADRCVPVTRDAHRGRAGLVEGQDDRRHSPQEDAEQPDDDEVVRGVGQGAGVASVADVPADVPDEPEQGADDRRGVNQNRQGYPAGPVEYLAQLVGDPRQPLDAMGAVGMAHPQHQQA